MKPSSSSPSRIEAVYDRIFHAKSAEEEWELWHGRTADDLVRIRNEGAMPKERTDPSERKYYEWLQRDVLRLLGDHRGKIKSMLEVGCGSAALSASLQPELAADAYLLDNSETALEYARFVSQDIDDSVSYLRASAEQIPLADESVDFVHSVGLIEHFNDAVIHQMVDEMRRVLKKDGLLFLAVPNFFSPDLLTLWARYGKGTERLIGKKQLAAYAWESALEPVTTGHTSYVLDKSLSGWLPPAIEEAVGKKGLGFLNYVLAKKPQ